MNSEEYEVMARVEADHWWYRGLRDALSRVLARFGLPDRPRVLDAGCGTGETLRFLSSRLSPSYLGGFDSSATALDFAREKAPDADLYASDICDPELRSFDLDLIVSLDVIYIPGAARAADGLRRLVSQLRPGGLFIVNLPAYEWMRSEHDLAIHTSERYTRPRVDRLLGAAGLEVAFSSYRLCALFPMVVASRLGSLWRTSHSPGDRDQARSDLHSVPGPALSRLLLACVRAENALLSRGTALPWGSSVFAVGRRRRS